MPRPTKNKSRTVATPFTVVAGVPEMAVEWNRLVSGLKNGTLSGAERSIAKKLARAVQHLQTNPFHPGLQSHEIAALTARYGQKVFESYLENNTPAAGRIFWVYRPRYITLIGLEPHPEDSKRGYARLPLSSLPPIVREAIRKYSTLREIPLPHPIRLDVDPVDTLLEDRNSKE